MDKDRAWSALRRATADKTRTWRTRPIRQRPPLPVAEFAAAALVPDDYDTLALVDAIRRVLGPHFGLPAGAFHPEDTVRELRQLTAKDCDLFELLMLAEMELGRTPGSGSLPGVWQPETVGDIVQALVRALE